MTRTYRAGKVEAYLPIAEIGESLLFEDEDDVIVFLEHCGVDVISKLLLVIFREDLLFFCLDHGD